MPPWLIERLERDRHDRRHFDCGNVDLNRWLENVAGQYEDRDLARTYVATLPDDPRVLGYYAVASHHVQFEWLPAPEAKGLPKHQHLPVILLGKLAVCRSVQGQGLGGIMLLDALRLAEHVSARIGARAVEVDAIDDTAKAFYTKHGFVELLDNPNHLYMSMRLIRKLNLPPWRAK